jgi:site-specific DNA-methyltransferase (adenine-specific)
LWLTECFRIAKEGSPICMFSDWRQLPTVTDVFQASGWIWRGIAVWDKTEACRPCIGRFSSQCEYIIWGSKGSLPSRKEVGCLPGVYRQIVLQKDKFHITGKPTSVMNAIVKICPPGGKILDPFMGSGTTGVAALNSRRSFIGIELEPGYFEIAKKRIEETRSG